VPLALAVLIPRSVLGQAIQTAEGFRGHASQGGWSKKKPEGNDIRSGNVE
jgi:hypothetical protein